MRALLLLAVFLCGQAGPVWAQSPSAPNAAAALTAAATAPKNTASGQAQTATSGTDLQNLVSVLQNDKQRAILVGQLQSLMAAQKATTPSATPSAATTAQGLVEGLTTKFDTIGSEMLDIVGIARAAPQAVSWLTAQGESPTARLMWVDALARLAIVFFAATAAAVIFGRLLRPVRARVAWPRRETLGRWIAQFVVMLILALVPIAVFTAIAPVILAALNPAWPARPVAAVAIAAIFRAQIVLAVAWTIFLSPASPYFLRLGEESRTYLYIWIRRFTLWAVYGFALAELLTTLGAANAVDDMILRLTTIVLAGLAIVFILQNQVAVTTFLRSDADQPRTGMFRTIRLALADTWHILAIVYILGSFGSYLVDLHGGIGFVLRATIISIAVMIGAGLATHLVHILNRRGFELNGDMRSRYPGLEARANRYLPALVFVISALVYVVAIVLLLQAWGIDVIGWLELQSVRRILSSLASIAIVLVIAVSLWELINAAIERALTGGSAARQAQVSARLRTLLPLARSTVLIAIVTMTGIIVLSQLGVDIGPLLAGAGIIGIAVGLGSQQLVRDIINGIFILIENTISIGDYVDVGGGHAGNVEELSIRSMRLRDGNGAVHTVPFSSVTMVVNTNRGVGNAAVNVSIALGQDADRAARIMAEIVTAMRQEPVFKLQILSDLQYWGVDKLDGSAVTLAGQIVCTDGGRWPVQREFNRRVMLRFKAEGIALAIPTQALIVRGQEPKSREPEMSYVTPFRAPRGDRG